MESRRTYGSGSLSQRKDGLWVGRVYSGWTPNGTRRRLTVSAKTKPEAARKLRELQRRLASGDVPTSGTSGRTTIQTWSKAWLPLHATRVRPSTYVTDAGAVRKWIVPTIGHRRIADLTPADLRALRDAITTAGRSTTTALHAHKILLKMLKDATIEGHPVPPRILAAPKPKKAAHDRDAIPMEQLAKILRIVLARPDRSRWVAAVLNGMRQGEVLGLEWSRVHLERGELDVSWQLQRLPLTHESPDGWDARPVIDRYWWTRPKTAAGQRIIPLVPWLVDALRDDLASWAPNPWGLVWAGPDGAPISKDSDRATWHAIQAEAGVSHPSGRAWHVHECRHTAITMLIRAGVSDHTIERIVGQAALVRAYAHMDQSDTRAALVASADVLGLTRPAIEAAAGARGDAGSGSS